MEAALARDIHSRAQLDVAQGARPISTGVTGQHADVPMGSFFGEKMFMADARSEP